MSWLRWEPVEGAEGHPCARECHTMDVVGEYVYAYGGNDIRRRFGDMHRLDMGACRGGVEGGKRGGRGRVARGPGRAVRERSGRARAGVRRGCGGEGVGAGRAQRT